MLKFLFDSDIWQEIYGGIRKNKTRTIITIIGVLWGVFLLVVLLGTARGMENNFKNLFGDSATNSVAIWTKTTDQPFKGFQRGRKIQFNYKDIDVLKNEYKNDLEHIAPRCQTFGLIVNNLKSGSFPICGDYPVLDKIQKKKLIYGRFLNENDIKNKSKVVVIEEQIYDQIFGNGEYPIGKYLLIENINYKIIGVYRSAGFVDFDDPSCYIPFTTFQQVYNRGNRIDWMLVTLKNGIDVSFFEKKIILTLKMLHEVSPKDKRAIASFNLAKEVAKITGFLTGMQFLTWFVGIATLIAGVFAIGNILLITVKERTKEIGIRRAIGATPFTIKRQVVLESIFLTSIAGMLGVIIGAGVLYMIDALLGSGSEAMLLNPTVNIPIILIAFLLLIVFGTLIGLLPAYVATKMKPIEALREE